MYVILALEDKQLRKFKLDAKIEVGGYVFDLDDIHVRMGIV